MESLDAVLIKERKQGRNNRVFVEVIKRAAQMNERCKSLSLINQKAGASLRYFSLVLLSTWIWVFGFFFRPLFRYIQLHMKSVNWIKRNRSNRLTMATIGSKNHQQISCSNRFVCNRVTLVNQNHIDGPSYALSDNSLTELSIRSSLEALGRGTRDLTRRRI